SPVQSSYEDFCFFFQAEDGIRDFHVTGVQTCALPIYLGVGGDEIHHRQQRDRRVPAVCGGAGDIGFDELGDGGVLEGVGARTREIGRASCRERAWSSSEHTELQTTQTYELHMTRRR